MRLEILDLSKYSEEHELSSQYKSMARTYIKLLSSQVPESFLEKSENEEAALKQLLVVVYGTMEFTDDDK